MLAAAALAAVAVVVVVAVLLWPRQAPLPAVTPSAAPTAGPPMPTAGPPTPTARPTAAIAQSKAATAARVKYQAGDSYLIVEFLDDDLVHFELSGLGPGPDVEQAIHSTPMVYRTDYPGPGTFADDGHGTLETAALKVQVDPVTLCFTATDIAREPDLLLSTVCPLDLAKEYKGVTFTPETFTNAYGLGEQFTDAGVMDGDWAGRIRASGDYGNFQGPWNNGNVGNDQFPIVYLAGAGSDSYALFFDNQYKQVWAFDKAPWRAVMRGEALRFYLLAGPDLPDLRQDYMELTGRPPVPPKKALGLWISEYGFDNWAELEDKLRTLRENRFPVDGFVLDLQWYGGIQANSDDTRMGSLTWDEANFPDPQEEIARLRDEEGVGIVVIEQSYVGKGLPEHAALAEEGYLVRDGCETCPPAYLASNPWWGQGGMIDWTNDAAGAFWHDWKRQPLIAAGVVGHWTDLGEPEAYKAGAWYWGFSEGDESLHGHADVHNLYNLKWSQSIYEGYVRNGDAQRPFILSRSGTSGIQRYGTALWSGDISSLLTSLAGHQNVQMHMAMSGVDYYGADIGGFFRQGGNVDEMYTQWFASGTAFDIPARAHTFNLCNCNETAPDRVGDLQSNLANVRQRYELSPYLYSLAHRAYLYGEPVIPPLVYYYQTDPNVRELAGEKLLGRDLLVAAVAQSGQVERDVYLPAGTWVDYHSGRWYRSTGQSFGPFLVYPGGLFRLPMFVRAGAIIPQMYVDEQTMNVLGRRLDGSTRDELIVRVYADAVPSEFTLYEDDGQTVAYQQGQVRTTLLSQRLAGDTETVTIAPAGGTYAGAPERRDNVVRLFTDGLVAGSVALNGAVLPEYGSAAELAAADSGWYDAGNGQVVARSGSMAVSAAKEFVFALARPPAVTPQPTPEPLPAYWPTDGWRASTPEMQGMDSAQLARAVDYAYRKLPLRRMLLIRHGYAVLDASFYWPAPLPELDRAAVTIPFLSTLVGIAIDQGRIESVQQPVLDFFPGRTIANLDERKQALTVEHLLTMAAGFECDPAETTAQMRASADWVQYVLDLPMQAQPGSGFSYCPVTNHLLSAIVQQATGMSALDYARENLFQPLGIVSVTWSADPQGVSDGWGALQMAPEDMAKLGYLYLNQGQWDGRQVVSAAWVQAATSARGSSEAGGYGYGWWTDAGGGYNAWNPDGGQVLVVEPGAQGVAVLTGLVQQADPLGLQLLWAAYVVPAVQSDGPLPENPAGLAALQAAVAAAGEGPQPQPVPPLPAIAGQVSGQTYRLDANDIGWEAITLTFPGGSAAQLSLVGGGMRVDLPVGLDNVWRATPPDAPVGSRGLAARGWWEDEATFVVEVAVPYTRESVRLSLAFAGDAVEVRIEEMGGSLTIVGHRQQ